MISLIDVRCLLHFESVPLNVLYEFLTFKTVFSSEVFVGFFFVFRVFMLFCLVG